MKAKMFILRFVFFWRQKHLKVPRQFRAATAIEIRDIKARKMAQKSHSGETADIFTLYIKEYVKIII